LALVGILVQRWLPELKDHNNRLLSLFQAITIGMTIVIPVFAIVWSKGNSIMWIALLLWIIYILWLRKEQTSSNENRKYNLCWSTISILLVLLIGIFALSYYLFFVRSGGALCGDHLFYAIASCFMMKEHQESTSFLSLFITHSPYHYGDLWITTFAATLFGLKPLYVLLLITYPFLCFVLILGVAALCKSLAEMNDLYAIIHGVVFLFFLPIVSIAIPWIRPMYASPKLLMVAIFGVWSLIMITQKNYSMAFLALCFLIPFYSTTIPGVLTFLFLFGIVIKSQNTHSWRCLLNEYSIISIVLAILFVLYYSIQKKTPIEEPVRFLYDGNWIINALSFAAKRSIRTIILLIPSALILLYLCKKGRNIKTNGCIFIAFIISCIVSSIVGGFMREISRDGGQITTNYVDVMIIIICYSVMVWGVYQLRNKIQKIPYCVVCSLFLLYPIFNHSLKDNNNYILGERNTKIDDILIKEFAGKEAKFASINVPLDDNGEINWHHGFAFMPHLLSSGFYAPYNLSEIDLPENYPPVWDDSHNHAFWQYVYLQKQHDTYISNEQSMSDFVNDMGVEYIIVDYGAVLPEVFNDKVTLFIEEADSKLYKVTSKNSTYEKE